MVDDHLRSDIDHQLENFWSDQLTFVSKISTEVQLCELDQEVAEVASQLTPCGEIHKNTPTPFKKFFFPFLRAGGCTKNKLQYNEVII